MSMLDTYPTPHPLAARCAQLLQARRQTVAVCESSAGGLITAALVAVPGCSAFFVGGCVAYAPEAREYLLGMRPETFGDLRPCTEAYALLCARQLRARLGCDWALAETGATGPTPNPYGAPPGRACLAVGGRVERVRERQNWCARTWQTRSQRARASDGRGTSAERAQGARQVTRGASGRDR